MSGSGCLPFRRFAPSTLECDEVKGPKGRSASSNPAVPAVGIVIPNYNTERFVGAAINSALAQDHTDVHVVVVDDGSTDNSRKLLERYTDRITLIFQENIGQLGACRTGAAILTTPIVIFLDADDVLARNAAATVASAWRPGVSKIQYRLEVIDSEGTPLGIVFPKYPPGLSPAAVRRQLLRTGSYVCPPGLGNAYARRVLLSLPRTEVEPVFADSVYATFAPLEGDVLTLPMTLGQYRVHGNNLWSMSKLDIAKVERRREIEFNRTAFLDEICRQRGIPFDLDGALGEQLSYQEHSLAIVKFGSKGWRSYPRALTALGKALPAILKSDLSLGQRLLLGLWAVSVGLLPRPLASFALMQRMAPTVRWRWVERLVR